VDAVDGLGYVSHRQLAGMPVEDVERHRGVHGVAQENLVPLRFIEIPGQRRLGAPSPLMSSTNCLRMPSTLGIFEPRPTQMPS
jgi:hypothetical protein